MRRLAPWLLGAALVPGVCALVGCGGSGDSASPTIPVIGRAHTYRLSGFQPAGRIEPGKPTKVTFAIQQPDGQILTKYKTGAGPHTGVHLIIVRNDLSSIDHRHPPLKNGRATETVTFPTPGHYLVVVDAYPKNGSQPNFQLKRFVTVDGKATRQPLPPFKATQVVDGYTFTMHGKPALKAIQAALLKITVTGPNGKPAVFQPWFGALAHAIFFRAGSLDYFHTHVCAPGASGCASLPGVARIPGTSAVPGKMTVGVLVPVAGTWRLFLQCKVNGHVLTVPFTLKVT